MERYIGDTFNVSREEWINDLYRNFFLDNISVEQSGGDRLTIRFEGPTDIVTVTTGRREQTELREMLLLYGSDHECHLCGRFVPISMLICAHIKKRSKASEIERVDKSIVFPVCVFGCDKMLEDGWIGVSGNGKVFRLNPVVTTPDLELEIKKRLDRDVPAWNYMSEKYFAWHRDTHN